MLPNIRLMIAATIAAILMLICGFSMFATFRVSHAPLERVASVASLHLVTTNTATPAITVTATAPFNNRFDVGEPGSGSVVALAYAAPEPAEPAADVREPAAAEPASGDDPALSQQPATAEAEPETKPAETPAAAAPLIPPAESTIALAAPAIAEPIPEPAAQSREPEVASAPETVEPVLVLPDLASQAADKAERAEKTEKKAKRAHAAARTHRIHKARAVAQASAFEAQTTFRTATWWTQREPQRVSAKIRHAKITSTTTTPASRKTASTTAASATTTSTTATSATPASAIPASTASGDVISGVGGPFISVPSQ